MKIQDTKTRSLRRREFNTLCAALGLWLPAGSTMLAALSHGSALAAASGSQTDARSVKFHDGTLVPAVGQGSWHLAAGRRPEAIRSVNPQGRPLWCSILRAGLRSNDVALQREDSQLAKH